MDDPPRPGRHLQEVYDVTASLRQAQRDLSTLHARQSTARERVYSLNQEVQRIRQLTAEAPTTYPHDHTERVAMMSQLAASLQTAERALVVGEREFESVEVMVRRGERECVELEARLASSSESEPRAFAALEGERERGRVAAEVRVAVEAEGGGVVGRGAVRRAGGVVAGGVAREAAGAQALARTRELRAAQEGVAARQAATTRALAQQAQALKDSRLEERLDAVLSLKANLTAVHEGIGAGNDRAAAARVAKDASRAAEYAALLAQGLNPYEVWRARERDARAVAAVGRHEEGLERDKLAAVERVLVDDAKERQAELEATHKREELDDMRRRKQRGIREGETSAYLMERTVGGRDTLDPTGREGPRGTLYPSSLTLGKPPAWGLGRAAATGRLDTLAFQAGKPGMEGVGLQQAWIPQEEQMEGGGAAAAAAGDFTPSSQGATATAAGTGAAAGVTRKAGDRGVPGMGVSAPSVGPGGTRVVGVGPSGGRVFALRPLSLYEQRLQAGALERQRAGITGPQVAAGVAFGGDRDGFFTTPSPLHFKDFVPGTPMTLPATLTNASLSFNSFRFLDFPPTLRDLFKLTHTPPGRMSAGLTCPFTLQFLPRVNEDISTTLNILARTGPIAVPLLATTRKAVPVVTFPVVDAGAVTLGESEVVHIEVENAGVLAMEVRVAKRVMVGGFRGGVMEEEEEEEGKVWGGKDQGKEGEGGEEEEEVDPNSDVFFFPNTIHLEGYSKVRIPFTFTPAATGECAIPITLTFFSPGVAQAALAPGAAGAGVGAEVQPPPIDCLVRGRGYPTPLYLDRDVLDFRVCVVEKLYRGRVTVHNRGKVVAPMSLRLPPLLQRSGCLTVTPLEAFAQGRDVGTGAPGSATFEVELRPSEGLLQDPLALGALLAEVPVGDEEGVFPPSLLRATPITIPMELLSSAQVLPIPMIAKARVTPATLSLHPTAFDFGATPVGQGVVLPLTLTNDSALPQKWGFVKPPTGFSVSPGQGDGIGLLLPGESTTVQVTFVPPFPGEFGGGGGGGGSSSRGLPLTLRTSLNISYDIPVAGVGYTPPFSLSSTALLLSACAVGESEVSSTLLTNTSSTPQDFHVMVNHSSSGSGSGSSSSSTPEGDTFQGGLPLTILPSTGTLSPGQSVSLAVRFSPTPHYFQQGLGAQRAREEGIAGLALEALGERGMRGGERGVGAEVGAQGEQPIYPPREIAPPSLHHTWMCPVFWRPHVHHSVLNPEGEREVGVGVGAGRVPPPSLSLSLPPPPPPPTFQSSSLLLHVSSCTLPTALTISPNAHAFGAVPVGHSGEFVFTLTNTSPVPMALSPEPLPPSSGFLLLTPPPPTLPPGTSTRLTLSFSPKHHRVYTALWRVGVVGETPRVSAALTGVGISPRLTITPELGGSVDFGGVLVGDSKSKTFSLFNGTPFPMPFTLEEEGGFSPHQPSPFSSFSSSFSSSHNPPPFTISPREGVVPGGGGSVQVTVTFSPRCAPPSARPFAAQFLLLVPAQDKGSENHIYLLGRGFDRSVFAHPPLLPPGQGLPPSAGDAAGAGAAGAAGEVATPLVPLSPLDTEGAVMEALEVGGGGGGGGGGGYRVFPQDVAPQVAQYDSYFFDFSTSPTVMGGGAGGGRGVRLLPPPLPINTPAIPYNAPYPAAPTTLSRELTLGCFDRASNSSSSGSGGEGWEVVLCGGAGVGVVTASPSAPASAPASYTITLPPTITSPGGVSRPHNFSVSSTSGTLPVGHKVGVAFTFTPSPPKRGVKGAVLKRPGEWQEVEALVVLKGGVMVEGAPEERLVKVFLRAFLPGTE